jgi:hypothetical protein
LLGFEVDEDQLMRYSDLIEHPMHREAGGTGRVVEGVHVSRSDRAPSPLEGEGWGEGYSITIFDNLSKFYSLCNSNWISLEQIISRIRSWTTILPNEAEPRALDRGLIYLGT